MSDQPQGNGEPGSPQGTSAPGALSEDKLRDMIVQVANQAFTARGKLLKKEITEEFSKGLDPISKRLDEALSAVAPSGKGKKGGGDEDGASSDPKVRGIEKRLADMEAENSRYKAEIASERARAKDLDMRSKLRDSLVSNGVDAMRARHAIALLVDSDKRVRREEDSDDLIFIDSDSQPIDFNTGLKAWLKSDDGRHFMPPTGARGSGDQQRSGAGSAQKSNAEPTATDIGMGLLAQFGGTPVG